MRNLLKLLLAGDARVCVSATRLADSDCAAGKKGRSLMYQQAACVADWLETTWAEPTEMAETSTNTSDQAATGETTTATAIEPRTARVISIDELRQRLNIEPPAAPAPQTMETGERPRIVRRREAALAAC